MSSKKCPYCGFTHGKTVCEVEVAEERVLVPFYWIVRVYDREGNFRSQADITHHARSISSRKDWRKFLKAGARFFQISLTNRKKEKNQ